MTFANRPLRRDLWSIKSYFALMPNSNKSTAVVVALSVVIEKASVSDNNCAGGGTEQANKAGSQALNRGLIMRPGCCRAGQTSTQSSEKQVAQSLPGGQSSPRHWSSSFDGDEDDSQ